MDSSRKIKRYLDKSSSEHKFQPEKYAPITKGGIPPTKKKQSSQIWEMEKERLRNQRHRLRNTQKRMWDEKAEYEQAVAVKAQDGVNFCSREPDRLAWNPWSTWGKEEPKSGEEDPSNLRDK